METQTKMLNFTKPIKIYTFKDEGRVKLSFRISDNCVWNEWISIEHFQYICNNWNKEDGVQGLETNMGRVWWEHRNCGPRPECKPADFVAIDFSDWSFRISTDDMHSLVADFNTQLTTKNHWD